jgi:hypothetical protein
VSPVPTNVASEVVSVLLLKVYATWNCTPWDVRLSHSISRPSYHASASLLISRFVV